jgi:hypothetical protein
MAAFPLEFLGLMVPQRGGVTLTPSIAISEEYNDNIFLSNQNRQWDFITTFSPAVTLSVGLPTLQLVAGYTTSAQLYARETDLNKALESQNAIAFGIYRLTPRVTLTLSDSFVYSQDSLDVGGFSTGRQESWGNTLIPGLQWQITPKDSLNLSATYALMRFEQGSGNDSDTYGFQATFNHAVTQRFTGTIGYGFGYLDPQGQDSSITHTPAAGFSYQFTRTLTGTIYGGASFTEIGDESFVTPSGSASLQQTLQFGSVGLRYDRSVYVAGAFGGSTDTQSVSAWLAVTNWARGLVVVLSPGYSQAESLSSRQSEKVDIKAFTLTLGAAYPITRYVTVYGGYRYFHQRAGGSSTATGPSAVDLNQVRFGLQFGYPIEF